MIDYERLRGYLLSNIAEGEAKLIEAANDAAYGMLRTTVGYGEAIGAGRRIVAKLEAQIHADRLLLAAVDRVEDRDTKSDATARKEHDALLRSLRGDVLPIDELVERVKDVLYELGRRNPCDGRIETGAKLAAFMRDRNRRIDEIELEVLKSAANSKRSLPGAIGTDARVFLDEYHAPKQPLPDRPIRREPRIGPTRNNLT